MSALSINVSHVYFLAAPRHDASQRRRPYAIRTILDQETRIEALEKKNKRLLVQVTALTNAEQNRKGTRDFVEGVAERRAADDNQEAEIHDLKARLDSLQQRIDLKTARN